MPARAANTWTRAIRHSTVRDTAARRRVPHGSSIRKSLLSVARANAPVLQGERFRGSIAGVRFATRRSTQRPPPSQQGGVRLVENSPPPPEDPSTAFPPPGAFCRACGRPIDPRAVVCPHCGVATGVGVPFAGPYDPQARSWIVALLLSVFLGSLGVDRFYLGKIGTGILKLITLGGLGIWWLIDVILIATGTMRDANGRLLNRVNL